MVVFGQGDLWSLGISPSDIHGGAGNLSLSFAIIRTHRRGWFCVSVAFAVLLNFLMPWFASVWLRARSETQSCLMFPFLHL